MTGRIVVAGKGEFQFALPEGGCGDGGVHGEPQNFIITGGTGAYASATGSGIMERSMSFGVGTELWTGTLAVPSLDFDTTPPTIGGASNKLVKVKKTARRAKVTYSVTASDAADGTVPVTCDPRSGSFFRVGRTRVSCTATDTSANTANASFTVTVRRR